MLRAIPRTIVITNRSLLLLLKTTLTANLIILVFFALSAQWTEAGIAFTFSLFTALYLMLARRVYLDTLERRTLKKDITQLARSICNNQDWCAQTDRGILILAPQNRCDMVIFQMSLEDMNAGFDSLDHTMQCPAEVYVLFMGIPDPLRFITVINYKVEGSGLHVPLNDTLGIKLDLFSLRNELVVASETELRSLIENIQYAQAYKG